jgi:hypothetical protein
LDTSGSISRKNPSFFYNIDWANRKLRFTIADLQGKYESTTVWKRPLQTALICKKELLDHGYFWQAEKIDFWIHRLQPRKADLRERSEEGSL